MQDFLLEYYFYLKAFHIISVIAWMAGLLYLPRLFVYHCDVPAESKTSEIFKLMEYRLARYIMGPAMHAAWTFALLMLYANPSLFQDGWMHAKLTCVILLTVVHVLLTRWRKAFAEDRNTKSAKFYRIWNEVPTVLMVLIVILAVTKPF
ncbi:MAG: protoporphyrinogen oxidase HemJ [Rhodospirillales bacterium]|nr:protoporphyrinogen oxidase HemJ [Rhodospirillales bacterium]MCB9980562.1 protoporphyrinogen oxidase HemJ [Rhodospirillales bacterium]